MSVNVSEWMRGEFEGKVYYNPQDWMKRDWNGDFFYELSKLGDIGCMKFCRDIGLISKYYECPKCGKEMKMVNHDRWYWRCRKKGENAHCIQRSVRKGTWFTNSHLSFGLILRLTYMWLNKIPHEGIVNDSGVAKQTVTEWRQSCREVCIDYCLRFDGQVGGNEIMVDIYEALLSRKDKLKIERQVNGNGVYIGLVRNSNACFVEVVEDRNALVLIEVIKKRILPGTTIMINCGTLYSSSQLLFKQLEVVHNVTIKSTHRTTDGTWSVVKKALQGNDLKDGEFNGEVAEYIWRRQNNCVISEKVHNFLKTISASFPPMSKDEFI